MTDVTATALLLGGLLYLEWQQQRQLQIKTKSSWLKVVVAIVAALLIVALFWSANTVSNLRLAILAILVASVGLYRQGLGKTKVITYGSVAHASDYRRYDRVITETIKQGTMVTFWSKKGGSYSLMFDQSEAQIRQFFKENLPQNVALLTAEEWATLENRDAQDDRQRQADMLAAIRNRPQRNRLPWQKRERRSEVTRKG
ncbi:hypothetical protein KTT66_10025 [Lacticaseibacillus casei]|uniref:YcxB-like protein domain-containing protein n=1 Tax=Lacticaseibacillus huelsenbergensis TaxID=3035291 RepID=A0ABY8DSN8_9LACO|nr:MULTISPECIES: hypothetical protein [Lacticaseibacillus]MDG3062100.1 hypothetical protein [Lacticaseibacillus sp. BCRC 81376]QVI36732.1 hypothetical protein KGS74_10815 [Lacticaseibacillus casei]QXG58523.1 hypothetical protein KTT66_10025 [Lacticaseibacillus casei]WFB40005.1 hypothetical protein LHUE1_000775 [Lacticaseibacillus huelsenbergensis]WFB41737.1 hypothetical protein LHUE2_002599 [Lacticaseibacillus huelsenbergensis]